MKTSLIFILLFLSSSIYTQQHYTGYAVDNYNGATGVYFQPASIVNSTTKFSLTGSFVRLTTTNFIGSNFMNKIGLTDNQKYKYNEPLNTGYRNNSFSLDVIGLKYEINHDNAVGYSLRYRYFKTIDGLPKEWAENNYTNYASNLLNTNSFNANKTSLQHFEYLEHLFNYARTIVDKGDVYMKAGVGLKLINGYIGDYLIGTGGQIKFNSQDSNNSLEFQDASFDYGKSENANSLINRNIGLGLDLGFVYEYRPDHLDHYYDMDGKTAIKRHNEPKYKYKIGASLTDIGRFKFTKDPLTYNFTGNAGAKTNASELIPSPSNFKDFTADAANFVQSDMLPQSTANSSQKETFTINLPTSLNLQFDYLIFKNLYVGYTGSLPLKLTNNRSKAHLKSIHSITPRFEKSQYSVMLPITIQASGQVNVGGAVRISENRLGVFFGSNNITWLFGQRAGFTSNLFAGVMLNFPYTVPPDYDLDKVSDNKDECPYDPGRLALKGCPDTDGDGISDKEDHCIYDQGPLKTRGCPDRDNDGVIDLNDQCPDDAGLAIHYGCPDRDKDGIIDVADRCPDIPGIEMNNGCPFENPGCCMDADGDGIPDNMDKCPTVSGSLYNNGCPIDSSNLAKINWEEKRQLFDPNHTKQQKKDLIKEGKSLKTNTPERGMVITDSSEVFDFNDGKKLVHTLVIFFAHDDATIEEKFQLDIDQFLNAKGINRNDQLIYAVVGHTDSDGTADYNIILSQKRADIVRRTLINRGIKPENIQKFYFGESKPLRSNDTEVDKGFNRRVEVYVLF
jgi:outer membrane protein OmpA-like peptidoglycan-associated protein